MQSDAALQYNELSASVQTRISPQLWISLSIALSSTACHAFYAVSGRVVTCDTQAPIAGAEVRVNVPEIEHRGKATTDQHGEFRVAVNHPPADMASELSVSKPGYTASQHSVKDPDVPQALCLKPARPAR